MSYRASETTHNVINIETGVYWCPRLEVRHKLALRQLGTDVTPLTRASSKHIYLALLLHDPLRNPEFLGPKGLIVDRRGGYVVSAQGARGVLVQPSLDAVLVEVTCSRQ